MIGAYGFAIWSEPVWQAVVVLAVGCLFLAVSGMVAVVLVRTGVDTGPVPLRRSARAWLWAFAIGAALFGLYLLIVQAHLWMTGWVK